VNGSLGRITVKKKREDRMSIRILLAAALIAGATHSPALAQQVPGSLESYKPHEIVEAVISEGGTVRLTPDQLKRLDSLHLSVRDERHRWAAAPGNKAHQTLRMRPMISQKRAYSDALAILTATQREELARTFAAPGYVPRVPSLATAVPTSLESLAPHEVVEAFLAERATLGLSPQQYRDLETLHVAIRDEQHRYTRQAHGAKGPEHMMMEPMITRRRAYNDALSYLTTEQQDRATRRFRDPAYRAPQKAAEK
jgi:hypothetical protein